MSTIDDNELILFHYRDGHDSARLEEIAQALATSPDLARRYDALLCLLGTVDHESIPEPDDGLAERVWRGLQPRLGLSASSMQIESAKTPVEARVGDAIGLTVARNGQRRRRRRWTIGLAGGSAAAMLALLAIGLRTPELRPVEPVPRAVAITSAAAPLAPAAATGRERVADRILDAQLTAHLRSMQGLLQSVVNNDGGALMPIDDDYVRSLVEDNRVYAAAADRRGHKALAGFLKTLDPILIELANRSDGGDIQFNREGMRDVVRDNDMLFRVRAAEARLLARSASRV